MVLNEKIDYNKISKKALADIFGLSYSTIMKWQRLGILNEKLREIEQVNLLYEKFRTYRKIRNKDKEPKSRFLKGENFSFNF